MRASRARGELLELRRVWLMTRGLKLKQVAVPRVRVVEIKTEPDPLGLVRTTPGFVRQS